MRPRDRAALILIFTALVFSTLAIGGAPRWAACTAAALSMATALPYLTSRRTATRPAVLLFPLAVMSALTVLQVVPMPVALAELLVPSKVTLLRENARAWGDPGPRWVAASFDPAATLVELAKLIGYLGLAWTCARLASERQARRWLIIAPASVATLAAVVTLAHLAVGTREVYGVYKTSTNLDFVGPLVSVNHLASLLGLAIPLAGALALQSRGLRRVTWFAVVCVLTATLLLAGSRGGVLGLVAGLTVTATVLLVQRRAGPDDARPLSPTVSVPAALIAAGIVAVLVLLSAGPVTRDLSRTTLAEMHEPHSKPQVWKRAANMTADHRWLGVGKGGFESSFMSHAENGSVIYSHVENGYLQAVVDWGVPGAALLFLSLGTAALTAMRRWRHGTLEAGALGALAGLAVHDFADFSIELPAVAMAAIVASALLFPERLAAARRQDDRRAPRSALALRGACIGFGFLLIGLAASPMGRRAADDYERVTAAPSGARLALARAALERHPASALIAGRAAEALFDLRDPRAIKLMARSLTMNSNHAGLRRLAARMLVVSNRPEQAAGEFAAAIRLSRDVRPIVADVVLAFDDAEQIAAALPTEPGHAAAIIRSLGDRRAAALAYAKRVAQVNASDPEMQALLAAAALEAGDGLGAVAPASAAWKMAPLARHAVVLGRARAMAGDPVSAISLVVRAAEQTASEPAVERLRLIGLLADLQLSIGDLAGAKAALERCRDIAVADRANLALIHRRLADVEDRLGNRNQAAWERQRAHELEAAP